MKKTWLQMPQGQFKHHWAHRDSWFLESDLFKCNHWTDQNTRHHFKPFARWVDGPAWTSTWHIGWQKPKWISPGLLLPPVKHCRCFLRIHSSLLQHRSVSLLVGHQQQGSGLKLCMPVAHQHQLTFTIAYHTQTTIPMALSETVKWSFSSQMSLTNAWSLRRCCWRVNLFISTC